MGQVARVTTGSGNVESRLDAVRQQMNELLLVVDDFIEFGEPQNPNDPTSTTLAGATGVDASHNGTISNVNGSWVEVLLTATGIADTTFTHNLFLDPNYTVPVTGEPNCRWIHFAVMHDGTNKDGTSDITFSLKFMGGTVTGSSIQLRTNLATVGTAVTIDGNHPVKICLFFTKATRGV
jgi:hypothetical protein